MYRVTTSNKDPQLFVIRQKDRKVDVSGLFTSSIFCILTPSIFLTYFQLYLTPALSQMMSFPRSCECLSQRVAPWIITYRRWYMILFLSHLRIRQAHVWTRTPYNLFFKFLSSKFLRNDRILCNLIRISIDIVNCWYTYIFRRLAFRAYNKIVFFILAITCFLKLIQKFKTIWIKVLMRLTGNPIISKNNSAKIMKKKRVGWNKYDVLYVFLIRFF